MPRLEVSAIVTAWGECALGTQWTEARDASMHRTAPPRQERSYEKPCSGRGWALQVPVRFLPGFSRRLQQQTCVLPFPLETEASSHKTLAVKWVGNLCAPSLPGIDKGESFPWIGYTISES